MKTGTVINRSDFHSSDNAFSIVATRRQKMEGSLIQHRDRVFINDIKLVKLSKDDILIYLCPHKRPGEEPRDTKRPGSLKFSKTLSAAETTAIRIPWHYKQTRVKMITKVRERKLRNAHATFR